MRVGEYRIVCDVDDAGEVVTVYRIRHRREAYRRE
jgi:mRNA-degrading endonuclease RelE of RelBE toxin-antitoxin system